MPTKTFSEMGREEEERVEREQAERDAETAERDREGESEPEPETPPPPPAPAPPPITQKDIDKRTAQLENEAQRHAKRMQEIVGQDFGGLVQCPLCEWPGFVYPPDLKPVDDDIAANVLAFIGGEQGPQLKQDPNAVACEACDGLGFLATGSKREGYTEQACAKCGGQGWHAKELPGQAAPPPPPAYPQGMTFGPPPSNGPGAPPQPFWDVASNSWKLPGQ